jgi:pyridoxal phosphate enzyme (YggS family)
MYLERLEGALPGLRERLKRACQSAGRSDADSIIVVAVTKGHPLEAMQAARTAGLEVIGENRVQEAQKKWETAGDLGLSWHLVGHLQRNKVRQALRMFELIHSVDSLRLAATIDKEAERLGRRASVLIQVNASGEESKYGFSADDALGLIGEICALEHLRVEGLMTMAPFTADDVVLRGTFRRTRELFDRCRANLEKFEGRRKAARWSESALRCLGSGYDD